MKYGYVQAHHREFRVTRMCQVLQVSRSGFNTWQHRLANPRKQANQALIARMRVLHQETREADGARKMWHLLTREGLACGRHRAARLRRLAGIVALRRRRYIHTVQARHPESPQPTVCRVGKESRVGGGSDVRPYAHSWLTVAMLRDLYSRRVTCRTA